MKKCCNCGKEKELEEFVKDNRRRDGYSTLCKECKRERDKIRYYEKKNEDEFHSKKLEHNRKYKEKHKEEILQKAYEYNSRPEVIERKAN